MARAKQDLGNIQSPTDEVEESVKRHNLRLVFRTVRKIASSPSLKQPRRCPNVAGRRSVTPFNGGNLGVLALSLSERIEPSPSDTVSKSGFRLCSIVPFQILPFLTTHQRWARSGVQFGN